MLGLAPLWHILADLIRAPMLQLLLAFVLLSVVISVSQEQRTERALEALRDLTGPRELAIHDGQTERVAGRELVRGDPLLLAEMAPPLPTPLPTPTRSRVPR